MATLFLLIIYLAFISLGLPDSLLGSAWTVMRYDLNASLASAGIISIIVNAGTIISSLLSEKLIKRFGTGKVTFFSVMATAVALFGYSKAPSIVWLTLFAVPLGLGGGSVDAALNNYVALHYKPHHMSWLHCFWGVGATLGPIIMAQNIKNNSNWSNGFLTVSLIQFTLVAILLFTLPLWKIVPQSIKLDTENSNQEQKNINDNSNKIPILKVKGVKPAVAAFFFYCGVELTIGLWGSSYLVHIKELSPATAARWVSMYYAGITIGRLLTGFITMKVSSKQLIRFGQIIIFLGTIFMILPFPELFSLFGLILMGFGCAPIFPCMLHETPNRFGEEQSQKIMGIQMACAYTGSTFLPPLLGLIATRTSIIILPIFLLGYTIAMLISSERINVIMRSKRRS
jgi:fucose permease